jgi:hypothetical protein
MLRFDNTVFASTRGRLAGLQYFGSLAYHERVGTLVRGLVGYTW